MILASLHSDRTQVKGLTVAKARVKFAVLADTTGKCAEPVQHLVWYNQWAVYAQCKITQ